MGNSIQHTESGQGFSSGKSSKRYKAIAYTWGTDAGRAHCESGCVEMNLSAGSEKALKKLRRLARVHVEKTGHIVRLHLDSQGIVRPRRDGE